MPGCTLLFSMPGCTSNFFSPEKCPDFSASQFCLGIPSTLYRRKRIGGRYEEQELSRSTSAKFMKECGEQPLSGQWTQTEHYILLAILHYVCAEKVYNALKHIDRIHDIYSAVKQVIVSSDIFVSVTAKSQKQIKAKIQHLINEEELLSRCSSVNILPV